ncbi:MAG: hypothetical protein HY554_03055 [Elusimicrobia bacterium]|nr:hypothetical protein [Elusimicrobiota bacterium]
MTFAILIAALCAAANAEKLPADLEDKSLDTIFDQTKTRPGQPVFLGKRERARIAALEVDWASIDKDLAALKDIYRELEARKGRSATPAQAEAILAEMWSNRDEYARLMELRSKVILELSALRKLRPEQKRRGPGKPPEPPIAKDTTSPRSLELQRLKTLTEAIGLYRGTLEGDPEALAEWRQRNEEAAGKYRKEHPGKNPPPELVPPPPDPKEPENWQHLAGWAGETRKQLDGFVGGIAKELRTSARPDPELEELLRQAREIQRQAQAVAENIQPR